MKRFIACLALICFFGTVHAQSKPVIEEPAYKKDPRMPDFNILLPDSTMFARKDVPVANYDYTIIIYFSPDCGHCQHEAQEIVKHMDSLKNTFFVWVAYKPLEDIRGFAQYYKLDQFANVKLGRDPQYFVPSFFRVTRTPFVVVYNKKGLLEKVFDPEVGPVPEAEDLVKLVNKLN